MNVCRFLRSCFSVGESHQPGAAYQPLVCPVSQSRALLHSVRAGKVRLDSPGLLPTTRTRPRAEGPVPVCESFAVSTWPAASCACVVP